MLKRIQCLSAIFIVFVLSGCSQAPVEIVSLSTQQISRYTVRGGDTLQSISVGFGVSRQHLIDWNDLQKPYELHAGQVLILHPRADHHAAGSPIAKPTVLKQKTDRVETSQTVVKAQSTTAEKIAEKPLRVIRGVQYPQQPKQQKPKQKIAQQRVAQKKSVPSKKIAAQIDPKKTKSTLAVNCTRSSQQGWWWPTCGDIEQNYLVTGKNIIISGKKGQAVLAAESGRVVYAGGGIPNYGQVVIVQHKDQLLTVYGDNQSLLVKSGDQVTAGQKIATMGEYMSNTPGLLFEVRLHGNTQNPMNYFSKSH